MNRYIVTYDISNPKRLRSVYKILRGFGDHIQLSIFRCDLTARRYERLITRLTETIEPAEDQVLLIELGPSDSHSAERVSAIGREYREPDRGPSYF
jgi:CRISPR-associated protein Cas2